MADRAGVIDKAVGRSTCAIGRSKSPIKDLRVHHVNRVVPGKRIDLIEDIPELQFEFVFRHVADLRCRQDVGLAEKSMRGIMERLLPVHVDCKVDSAAAWDGVPACMFDHSNTPFRVQASTSTCEGTRPAEKSARDLATGRGVPP